jgi:Co/Zn/Cd efflux system component
LEPCWLASSRLLDCEVYDPRSIRWRKTLSFKRTVVVVAVLNLSYFGIEFITARRIGSVSLLADSIDFLEDASVNLLIVAALGMTLVWRARVGMVLAGILLIPAGVTLWTAWEKLRDPVAPDPLQLSLVGLGALVVNLTCALLLVGFRAKQGSLARAAFLSARNDAIANIAIIAAGLVTAFLIRSAWPDLIVGLGIAALNADAAHEVFTAAKAERVEAQA